MGKEYFKECQEIRNKQGGCKVGEAVITSGGDLPAKFVIHTVGPVWNDGKSNEEELLSRAYSNSLRIALQYQVETIAFPNISTGIYHFPKAKAAKIAIETVSEFLEETSAIKKVIFVCFDDENYSLYNAMLNKPG